MNYYEVAIADSSYHQAKPLTYSSAQKLSIGQLVKVQLRQNDAYGLIIGSSGKPGFAVKPLEDVPNLRALPGQIISLLSWLQSYYPSPLGSLSRLFIPTRLPLASQEYKYLSNNDNLPPLTDDQSKALSKIGPSGLHVLHGETGSGKTRIYIELARRSLKQQKSSIILSPEIGLTSQLSLAFKKAFGNRVVIVHSGMTQKKRIETWVQILQTDEPLIIIGARSALFSPVHKLGLIVIDESHDPAYKQDQSPYYWTPPVAAKLAEGHNACFIMGSATPLVSDYFFAKAKGRPVIRMTKVASGENSTDLKIELVDIKDRAQFSRSQHFSKILIDEIRESLKRREQSLIFLNRRGTARVVFCEKCGWQAVCPHCDLPLTYHGDSNLLRCHTCDFKTERPILCPNCGNTDITFKTIGTKAIYSELQRVFPEARIARFDADTKKSERLDSQYEAVRRGEADIIIGTQTIAKGLDLPLLSLVGVVAADTGLYLPDFSSAERTYQLLAQVIGRIGRGHRSGKAIIQTYQPESPLIKSVSIRDWHEFYNNEIKERQDFTFPPFCYLLKITSKRAASASAKSALEKLIVVLKKTNTHILIEGPSPAFHYKVGGKFVWQIIVKSKKRNKLTEIIRSLPKGVQYDIDPIDLL